MFGGTTWLFFDVTVQILLCAFSNKFEILQKSEIVLSCKVCWQNSVAQCNVTDNVFSVEFSANFQKIL